MICLSVWNQVGDECRCELLLFGPEGEGPAEISAGDTGQKKKTWWWCDRARRNKAVKKVLKWFNIWSNIQHLAFSRQSGVGPTWGSGTRDRAGPAGSRSDSDWHPGGGWQNRVWPGWAAPGPEPPGPCPALSSRNPSQPAPHPAATPSAPRCSLV